MNNIKMLNSDFRNVMDFIKDDFTIITDPPYNINYNYNSYNDNLPEKDYINLISSFKNKKLAIIHYPEETMKYFIPALGVPDVVNTWCYNSNLPNRQHRLINFYNLKPDYKKVLQPFKNPNDKRIKERIKKGVKGARSYDWFNDIQLVKVVISIKDYTRYEVELTIFGENIKMYVDLSNEVPGDLIDDFIQMEVFQYLRDSVRYVYYQKLI